jgi:acyl dehydratase
MRTVSLDGDPGLPLLLARAALTARGRATPDTLPDTEVERREVVVDRGRLAAYQRVCGYTVRDRLPSTYLHVLSFGLQATLMAEREFPLPLPGLVHVAQTLVAYRALDAAEPLSLRVRAEGLRPHARGAQVDLVATASVGGERVWSGTSTYLARGVTAPGGEPAGAPDGAAETANVRAAVPETELPEVGADRPPTARWRVPADAGRRYAAVSGDVNPIHLAAPAARLFGFPRAIAHGMWTAARCLASLEPRTPVASEVRVAFRRPVLLPSTVELRTKAEPDGWLFGLSSRSGSEHLRGELRSR